MDPEDQWRIEFKIRWTDSWVLDRVESSELEALHRASHVLTFQEDHVRVITPSGEIIEDSDPEGTLI